MLTADQQKWIDHLSDTDTVKVIPFDPTAEEKFQTVKKLVQSTLGTHVLVEHHGATSLGISGQDEIDVYIPISTSQFDTLLVSIEKLFGKPMSVYPLQRVRFVTNIADKHIDVFLINENSNNWLDCIKFETHLKNNHDDLDAYRKLKENGNGLSTREYYRRKIEFINKILLESSKARQ